MKSSDETPSRLSPLAQPFTSNRHIYPGFQKSSDFSQYPSDNFQDNYGGHSDTDFNFNGVLVSKSFMEKYCGGDGYGNGENSMSLKLGKPATKRMNDYGKVQTPSAGNPTLLLNYPICSDIVVSGCNNAQIEPHFLLKAESQSIYNEKLLMNKGKDIIHNVDTVFCGAVDVKENAELHVTCPVVRDVVTSNPIGSEASVLFHENSSVSCDYDDSELDSPCWKGTQLHQATSEVSKPVNEHALIIEPKETNSLNPKALHFYPGRGKIDEYFHANENARDDLTSLQSIASLDVTPPTRENTTLEGSFPLEVSGIQYSGHIHEPKMGAAHNGSMKSFIASSSCYLEPSLMKENYTVDSQIVTGSKNTSSFKRVGNADHRKYTYGKNVLNSSFSGVGDSSKFTETIFCPPTCSTQKFDVPQTTSVGFEHTDAQLKNGVEAANCLNPLARQFYPVGAKRHVNHQAKECSTGDSPYFVKLTSDFQEARESENAVLTNFFASRIENVASSSFSDVRDSSEFSETFSGASKRNTPKTSVQLLINSMHEMSEQLLHNCSNDLHSFTEQQHKKIECIISNLYICTINKDHRRISMPESVSLSKSYELGKSSDCNKSDTRTKNMTIIHGQERQNKFSDISVVGPLDRSYSNIEANNEISGLIRNTQTGEDMNAEALLYKKSWLEAEAALCYMKYKMGQMHIK